MAASLAAGASAMYADAKCVSPLLKIPTETNASVPCRRVSKEDCRTGNIVIVSQGLGWQLKSENGTALRVASAGSSLYGISLDVSSLPTFVNAQPWPRRPENSGIQAGLVKGTRGIIAATRAVAENSTVVVDSSFFIPAVELGPTGNANEEEDTKATDRCFQQKYRPRRFDDLIGHKYIGRVLKAHVENDIIKPAYLFSGPKGTGKTSAARIFASAINCTHPKLGRPCGRCKQCRASTRGNNTDIREIDAASNSGVENVRALVETVRYAPVSARYKVYIIDECHMLSKEAANALLKTLEEPPPHVVFILVTTDPQKLLEPVLSRCDWHKFKRISDSDAVNVIKKIAQKESIEVDDQALKLLAQLSDGSLRDATKMLGNVACLGERVTVELVEELLGVVPTAQVISVLANALQGDQDGAMCRQLEYVLQDKEPWQVLMRLTQLLVDLLTGDPRLKRPLSGRTDEQARKYLLKLADSPVGKINMRRALLKLQEAEVQVRQAPVPSLWLKSSLMQLPLFFSPVDLSSPSLAYQSTQSTYTGALPSGAPEINFQQVTLQPSLKAEEVTFRVADAADQVDFLPVADERARNHPESSANGAESKSQSASVELSHGEPSQSLESAVRVSVTGTEGDAAMSDSSACVQPEEEKFEGGPAHTEEFSAGSAAVGREGQHGEQPLENATAQHLQIEQSQTRDGTDLTVNRRLRQDMPVEVHFVPEPSHGSLLVVEEKESGDSWSVPQKQSGSMGHQGQLAGSTGEPEHLCTNGADGLEPAVGPEASQSGGADVSSDSEEGELGDGGEEAQLGKGADGPTGLNLEELKATALELITVKAHKTLLSTKGRILAVSASQVELEFPEGLMAKAQKPQPIKHFEAAFSKALDREVTVNLVSAAGLSDTKPAPAEKSVATPSQGTRNRSRSQPESQQVWEEVDEESPKVQGEEGAITAVGSGGRPATGKEVTAMRAAPQQKGRQNDGGNVRKGRKGSALFVDSRKAEDDSFHLQFSDEMAKEAWEEAKGDSKDLDAKAGMGEVVDDLESGYVGGDELPFATSVGASNLSESSEQEIGLVTEDASIEKKTAGKGKAGKWGEEIENEKRRIKAAKGAMQDGQRQAEQSAAGIAGFSEGRKARPSRDFDDGMATSDEDNNDYSPLVSIPENSDKPGRRPKLGSGGSREGYPRVINKPNRKTRERANERLLKAAGSLASSFQGKVCI